MDLSGICRSFLSLKTDPLLFSHNDWSTKKKCFNGEDMEFFMTKMGRKGRKKSKSSTRWKKGSWPVKRLSGPREWDAVLFPLVYKWWLWGCCVERAEDADHSKLPFFSLKLTMTQGLLHAVYLIFTRFTELNWILLHCNGAKKISCLWRVSIV